MQKIKITTITLFPEFLESYARFGIIARAIKNKVLQFKTVNLRSFGLTARQIVDDRPYGGGFGMLLRPDVVYKALQKSLPKNLGARKKTRVILLTPQGKPFKQAQAKRLAQYEQLIFVCGRYEGFDERIRKFVDEEISVGDYILMGGELPALTVTEAVLRLVPGVLGKQESTEIESFDGNQLEFPQYTKPEIWEVNRKKFRVPKVLLSGHHENVKIWREAEAEKRTQKRRPDLLQNTN